MKFTREHSKEPGRSRNHYVLWGVLGVVGTALVALVAALVWVQRPSRADIELVGPDEPQKARLSLRAGPQALLTQGGEPGLRR